jgi:hypothetical protein
MPAAHDEALRLAEAYAAVGITEIVLMLVASDPVAQAEQTAEFLPRRVRCNEITSAAGVPGADRLGTALRLTRRTEPLLVRAVPGRRPAGRAVQIMAEQGRRRRGRRSHRPRRRTCAGDNPGRHPRWRLSKYSAGPWRSLGSWAPNDVVLRDRTIRPFDAPIRL